MSNSIENKARERRFVELFKGAYESFPAGTILDDENQERPDIVVVTSKGKIGIEITALHNDKLKRAESECEKAVLESQLIYETYNLPKLRVSVHIGGSNSFKRKSRSEFANTIAELVKTNFPPTDGRVTLKNNFKDRAKFPYEIETIFIWRDSWREENLWTAPSAGLVRKDFVDELQSVISEKDSKLCSYASDCKEQWLLVIAEMGSPSTFFNPSEKTTNHSYKSSFNKIFLLESLTAKLFELKLVRNA
jgi:hypothetical protein